MTGRYPYSNNKPLHFTVVMGILSSPFIAAEKNTVDSRRGQVEVGAAIAISNKQHRDCDDSNCGEQKRGILWTIPAHFEVPSMFHSIILIMGSINKFMDKKRCSVMKEDRPIMI